MLRSYRASSLGMTMTTFVAIDFETATHRRDSACKVGLAAGCNGRIVASRTYAIRPPTPQFSFTEIHGVRWEDMRDAPTFGDLWPTLRGWIEDVEFLAAHNASFDRSALLACCARYRLRAPRTPFTCTSSLLAHNGEFARRRCQTSAGSCVFCSVTTTPDRTRKHARASYSPPKPQATREDRHPRCDGRRLWRTGAPSQPYLVADQRASPLTVAPADAGRARRVVARTAVTACVSAPPIGRQRLCAPRPPA